MANEFLNKIMSLAESDDETMLLLKQVVTPVNGEIEYYSDGTPRSVYPAYLPRRAKIKDGESWYINTGIYVKSLFPEGKPRAMLSCVTHVAFMMLDDIGSTKVYDGKKTLIKTPPLKPSWVMETSEGSFQWGYIFSIQPTKEEYTAAINAIIEADYTDHGATNAASCGVTPRAAQISSSEYSRSGLNSTSRALKLSRPFLRLTDPGKRQLRTALVAPWSV